MIWYLTLHVGCILRSRYYISNQILIAGKPIGNNWRLVGVDQPAGDCKYKLVPLRKIFYREPVPLRKIFSKGLLGYKVIICFGMV